MVNQIVRVWVLSLLIVLVGCGKEKASEGSGATAEGSEDTSALTRPTVPAWWGTCETFESCKMECPQGTKVKTGTLEKGVMYRACGSSDGKTVMGGIAVWSADGKLLRAGSMRGGKRNGVCGEWYDDGKPIYVGSYKNDRPSGVWVEYLKDGDERVFDIDEALRPARKHYDKLTAWLTAFHENLSIRTEEPKRFFAMSDADKNKDCKSRIAAVAKYVASHDIESSVRDEGDQALCKLADEFGPKAAVVTLALSERQLASDAESKANRILLGLALGCKGVMYDETDKVQADVLQGWRDGIAPWGKAYEKHACIKKALKL